MVALARGPSPMPVAFDQRLEKPEGTGVPSICRQRRPGVKNRVRFCPSTFAALRFTSEHPSTFFSYNSVFDPNAITKPECCASFGLGQGPSAGRRPLLPCAQACPWRSSPGPSCKARLRPGPLTTPGRLSQNIPSPSRSPIRRARCSCVNPRKHWHLREFGEAVR
jgi:hypothetical protein